MSHGVIAELAANARAGAVGEIVVASGDAVRDGDPLVVLETA